MKYAAACIHIKNEGDIIHEWMAFHRAVGFEHLIIIDNGSSDRSAEIVKAFPDPSSVTYLFQPVGDPSIFAVAILKSFGHLFEWMAFIDADEFLYPSNGGDIRTVLAEYPEAAGIGVYWHLYGSSGHLTKPQGRVIENMKRRAQSNFHSNHHVKTIVRPKHVWHPLGSHIFHVNGLLLDEQRRELNREPPYGYYPDISPSHEKLRINHYHVLSKEQYKRKIARGYFGQEAEKLEFMKERFDEMWGYHDQNEVLDASATSYVPLMRFYGDGPA